MSHASHCMPVRQFGRFALELKLSHFVIFLCFFLLGMPLSLTIPKPPNLIRVVTPTESMPSLVDYLVWSVLYTIVLFAALRHVRALKNFKFLIALLPLLYYAMATFFSDYALVPAAEIVQLIGSTALAAIVAKRLAIDFSGTIRLLHRTTFLNLFLNLTFVVLLPDQTVTSDGRWSSLAGNPNYLASIALLNVFLLMVLSLARESMSGLTVFCAILPIATIIGTRSATSTAVLIAVALLFIFFSSHRFDRIGRSIVRGGALFLLVFAATSLSFLFTIFLELLGKDATLTGRTAIWIDSIEALRGYFLFGHGVSVTTLDVGVTNWATHFHNGALQLIMSTGIVGLILFLLPLLLGLAMVPTLQDRRWKFFAFGSMIIFILFNTTEVGVFAWRHPVWLLYLSALFFVAFQRTPELN